MVDPASYSFAIRRASASVTLCVFTTTELSRSRFTTADGETLYFSARDRALSPASYRRMMSLSFLLPSRFESPCARYAAGCPVSLRSPGTARLRSSSRLSGQFKWLEQRSAAPARKNPRNPAGFLVSYGRCWPRCSCEHVGRHLRCRQPHDLRNSVVARLRRAVDCQRSVPSSSPAARARAAASARSRTRSLVRMFAT